MNEAKKLLHAESSRKQMTQAFGNTEMSFIILNHSSYARAIFNALNFFYLYAFGDFFWRDPAPPKRAERKQKIKPC